MTPTSAIVTTLRNSGPAVDSFIRYHLAIGFNHIFLFFDDPADPAIAYAEPYPNVTITGHDDALHARWQQQTWHYARLVGPDGQLNVNSRQQLNVELAAQMAREGGIDWLLHIDADELFYAPEFFQTPPKTVGDHFAALDRQQVQRVKYLNHEAIPEAIDSSDIFKSVTLFKRNPLTITQNGRLNRTQRGLVDATRQLSNNFFFFYGNGKSAARLEPGLLPEGVHDFQMASEQGSLPRLQRRLRGSRAIRWLEGRLPSLSGWLAKRLLNDERVKVATSKNPVILHYPCCSFEMFWTRYRILGYLTHRWRFSLETVRRLSDFHDRAHALASRGDVGAARAFFAEQMVMDDAVEISGLIASGLLERITEPASWLNRDIE